MSLERLMSDGLPLNRKEKFYTGTVFPAIVCAENFAHFNVFAGLLPGSPAFKIDPNPASANIQFFTEYSPLHSFVGDAKARMLEIPASNETPDIAILVNGEERRTLIVIEAKMFDHTSAAALATQLSRQTPFIDCVRASCRVECVYHAALIPEGLRREFDRFSFPMITWEQIRDGYAEVVPNNYFLGVLRFALTSFQELRGKGQQSRRANADALLPGGSIVRDYRSGALAYKTMGRTGGINGPAVAADVRTGAWRSREYEVRFDPDPVNANWFKIAEFDARVSSSEPRTDSSRMVTKLASKSKMLGAEIVRQHSRGTLWYKTVGRNRGLYGPEFAGDIQSGRWRSHNYEVSTSDIPENRNWFTVGDFIRSIGKDA